jgi:hypothetical protein
LFSCVGSSEWADLSDTKDVLSAREVARLMTSRSLLQALSTVERALHQNLYHSAHRMYGLLLVFVPFGLGLPLVLPLVSRLLWAGRE